MIPFDAIFPDIAKAEFRSMSILQPGPVPIDDYLFREFYCVEKGCDCRRVIFSVIGAKAAKVMATINHALDKRALLYEPGRETTLEPFGEQSRHAQALLDLCRDVVLQPDHRTRLMRHYRMVRESVENPEHPVQQVIARARDPQTSSPPGTKRSRPSRRGASLELRAPSSTAPASLRVGDYVRVRPGVRDPDFQDIDIGRWTGRVDWVGRRKRRTGETLCTVTWDRRTRRAFPPDLRARCEEEELEIGEADLDISELDRMGPPDAPEPGSLADLLEQAVGAEGWPDPHVVHSILAKGPDAIEPLREMVRLGSEDHQFSAAADLAAGLLGELRAASAITELLELLKRGAEDELDWTEDALSRIDGVSPDSLAAIIQDTAFSRGRREIAIAICEILCDDRPEAERLLTAALTSVLTSHIDRARDLTIADVEFASRVAFSLCWLAAPGTEPLIEAALKANIVDPGAIRQGRRAAKKREMDRVREEPWVPFLDLYTECYKEDDDDERDEEEDEPEGEDEPDEDGDEWETDVGEGPGIFDEDDAVPERPVTAPKVGRNDPCPCGSGKKFKKCCLGKTAVPASAPPRSSSPPPVWQVEVQLPPPKVPKPGTIELHTDVPRDLRRRLEQARLESIALLRTMDRAMVYGSEEELSPGLRAVFELEADCAEALWGLDQPLEAFSVSKMLRDTLASLDRLPAARSAALSVLEPEDLRHVMEIKDEVVRTIGPGECYSQVKGRDPAAEK